VIAGWQVLRQKKLPDVSMLMWPAVIIYMRKRAVEILGVTPLTVAIEYLSEAQIEIS
jgi:hypothetical protein